MVPATQKLPEDPRLWPWGTLGALLTTLVLGVTSLVAPDQLSFNDYYTQVVVVWGALSVGRGLAAKHDDAYYEGYGPITKFLNSFSWATVAAGFFAVVGYIIVLTHGGDGSMGYDELAAKVGALVGALGIGRGISTLKKDTTIGSMPIATHLLPPSSDPGVEITDANVGKLSAAAGVGDVPLSGEQHLGDEDMGAADDPGPIKAPPAEGPDTGTV
jgi:hypothetical protein